MEFKKNGFTIIEILIALSIIAILTTIGFANFSAGERVTRDKIRKSDLHQIASALEVYYQKFAKYIDGTPGVEGDCTSADTTTLYSLDPNIGILAFMNNQKVPTDPDTKDNYCYISVGSGASFRLFAKLENCSDKEIVNPSTCSSDPFNYSIVSPDLQIATLAQLNPTPTTGPSPTPTPGPTNIITTVDSTGDTGSYNSIAIGTDGLPIIAYLESTNVDLKVVKCGNAACSGGNTITAVDTTGSVGVEPSITIGTGGLPVISYIDGTNSNLKVAKCGNAACSSGNTFASLDIANDSGWDNSIAIGTDGFPVISYREVVNLDLKVAKCGNASCSSGNIITNVDSTGVVGQYTSIAIGTDGFPVISYEGGDTNDTLTVVKCGNASCSSGNIITDIEPAGNTAPTNSLAIGTDGSPVISYIVDTLDLKVVKCGNAACSGGNTITAVDTTGSVGYKTSLAIGTDGLPVISYIDGTNSNLKVAKCGNAACSSGNTITNLDSGVNNADTSLAIGTDGFPVISYQDAVSNDLKVLKCINSSCSP